MERELKKIFWLVLFLLFFVAAGETGAVTLNLEVAQGSDDAEEDTEPLTVNTNNPLWVCCDCVIEGPNPCYIRASGIRFINVTVPQGATIDSSFLWVWNYGAPNNDMACTLFCEDEDSCSTFPNVGGAYISTRTRTTANLNWEDENQSGIKYTRSENIGALIQEVVNRGGWKPGNALAILLFPGQAAAEWYGNARVYAYEEGDGFWPKLDIYYTEAEGEAPQRLMWKK